MADDVQTPSGLGSGGPALRRLVSVCVFCGSNPGHDPSFTEVAGRFGRLLADRKVSVVTGGGHVGMMGAVADAALAAGGQVRGVITRALLDREVGHRGLTELHVVDTMHQRKALMADLADAFVMLPGGFGTLEELFEAVTWSQLGIHDKPCGALDVAGYFDPLAALLDRAVDQGFVRPEHRGLLMVDEDPVSLLDRMAAWRPPGLQKWLDRSER